LTATILYILTTDGTLIPTAQMRKSHFSSLIPFLPPLFILVLSFGMYTFLSDQKTTIESSQKKAQGGEQQVLGERSPQIYISGGDSSYASGGMIALASTDDPYVTIQSYNVSGDVEVTMYEANEELLLTYLQHDSEGKQIVPTVDTGTLRKVTTVRETLGESDGTKITLPFAEEGVWYLTVKGSGVSANAMVLRSGVGVLVKEGDNEFVFWGQQFKTRRSIKEGTLTIYNLENGRKALQSVPFSANGIAKAKLTVDADIAYFKHNNTVAIVPINLRYLNTGFSYKAFREKKKQTRYFIFTDRPIYKPGDRVYFKAVLRDDDDARYTIPSGQALVKITQGYEDKDPLLQKEYPISKDGTINGEYLLPKTTTVGPYMLSISIPNAPEEEYDFWNSEYIDNTISFNVEYFRKPEFSLSIITEMNEIIAKDKSTFTISGQYFSGQPLAGEEVKYRVESADFYDYEYLNDRSFLGELLDENSDYDYFNYEQPVMEGTATLDRYGKAEIDLKTVFPKNSGKNQVFSISATIEDGSVDPAYARKNMIVYAGDYGIYRTDYSSGTRTNTNLSLPVKLVANDDSADLNGVQLMASIHRENWISYQENNKKYPSYKKEEENLPAVTAKTNEKGEATVQFVPKKSGSYDITVEGKDRRGNRIAKVFYIYVTDDETPYYNSEGRNDISIATDKQKYNPSDTVQLSIFSPIPNRDVFLSFERGRMQRYEVVSLNGKNGRVTVPLSDKDIPNMYATVASFSDSFLDTNTTNITVSPEKKRIKVHVTPDRKTYGPSDTVKVSVATTDITGSPVSADIALWAVDKAIFEVSDNKLGDIFKTFWKERYDTTQEAHSLEGIVVQQAEGGGGCFAEGTKVLMADGTELPIETVKVGDYVLTRNEQDASLVRAKVIGTHKAEVAGYLIVNGSLRVTPNHVMWINNSWVEAGSMQPGDILVDSSGRKIFVETIEWQLGKFTVYNLEIEKFHTYFAGNIWVHNQKGFVRNTFEDTAYWNPSIKTDASGKASVTFKLPDNLTTWTIAAVGDTLDTRVGQSVHEIVVSKRVIVRPIVPNIMRVGDEAYITALVQNFTDSQQTFELDLSFDGGEVALEGNKQVTIPSQASEEIVWKVLPKTQKEKAKLTFAARSTTNKNDADAITKEIPIQAFGFHERRGESGIGQKTYTIKLAGDSDLNKSRVVLSLSSTLTGMLPSAMDYLIDYPYGCVEQTTSRFVPAVIAKSNQDTFAAVLKNKKLDDMLAKGIARLKTQQHPDGGWSWWYHGESDYFISSYVVEYLLEARKNGAAVDNDMLTRAQEFFERAETQTQVNHNKIAQQYGLSLFGRGNTLPKIKAQYFTELTPDQLALLVMAYYRNGDRNPQTNGLTALQSMAKQMGDSVYWEPGSNVDFGSVDASTALAVRAITFAGGDRSIAARGVRYLTQNRKVDYWSNTFATAQVIRALTDFAKSGDESTPNFSYTVLADGKEIAKGTVSDRSKQLPELAVPITSSGTKLEVRQSGRGQLYSTLVVDEFHTDKNAKAQNRGLSITREYINEKGDQYTLAVGDTVKVNLTVSGLKTTENYAVIHDELPAGMIPLNPKLKNEQYGENTSSYYTSYDITDQEVTETGVVLSLYQMKDGKRTYTYRARVVSEGVYAVPPATVSLMYAPEIFGRSNAETVRIDRESSIIPSKLSREVIVALFRQNAAVIGIGMLLIIIGGAFILKRRGVTLSQVRHIALSILPSKKKKKAESESPSDTPTAK
jgi:alpha-2-macroglobulin